MAQPTRGRNSQAKNHLITIVLALIIACLATWFGYGRDHVTADPAATAAPGVTATAAPGVTATAAPTPLPGDGLTVTYLDVGQGDCTLLQCDGQVMLIDAAEGNQANKITAYLKQHGVTAIDYLICTHAHADHCGGMRAVIAAFPVRTLYSSVTSSRNGAFQRVMRAAETANLAITVPDVGDTFPLGSATVTVLGPQKHYSDVNNQSLILRVDYGSNAFLFTGDAEYESETDVLDAGENVRCDVIKAGHHGSHTSTGYRLLYEAQPKYAVISCGANNEYGHPHDDTLSRLRDADVTVYRTDLNGTIVCRSDGVNLTFTTEKEG